MNILRRFSMPAAFALLVFAAACGQTESTTEIETAAEPTTAPTAESNDVDVVVEDETDAEADESTSEDGTSIKIETEDGSIEYEESSTQPAN